LQHGTADGQSASGLTRRDGMKPETCTILKQAMPFPGFSPGQASLQPEFGIFTEK